VKTSQSRGWLELDSESEQAGEKAVSHRGKAMSLSGTHFSVAQLQGRVEQGVRDKGGECCQRSQEKQLHRVCVPQIKTFESRRLSQGAGSHDYGVWHVQRSSRDSVSSRLRKNQCFSSSPTAG
jgi:hypothetical protein